MGSRAKTLRRVITSDLESMREVQDHFNAAVECMGYGPDTATALVVGFAEALANAFKHGNRRDPAKCISVRCRFDATEAAIEVSDEGDGFDPKAVPDPTAEDNLDRPGGRGVLMMRAMFDEVEYNRGGREVRLVLSIGSSIQEFTAAA